MREAERHRNITKAFWTTTLHPANQSICNLLIRLREDFDTEVVEVINAGVPYFLVELVYPVDCLHVLELIAQSDRITKVSVDFDNALKCGKSCQHHSGHSECFSFPLLPGRGLRFAHEFIKCLNQIAQLRQLRLTCRDYYVNGIVSANWKELLLLGELLDPTEPAPLYSQLKLTIDGFSDAGFLTKLGHGLANNHRVQSLDISSNFTCYPCNQGCYSIAQGMIQNRSVKRLRVHNGSGIPYDLSMFSDLLLHNTALQTWSVDLSRCTEETMKRFSRGVQEGQHNLAELNIRWADSPVLPLRINYFPHLDIFLGGILALHGGINPNRITRLTFSPNVVWKEEDIQQFSSFLRQDKILQSLRIEGGRVTECRAHQRGSAKDVDTCQRFGCGCHDPYEDSFAPMINALQVNTTLLSFALDHVHLFQQDMSAFERVLDVNRTLSEIRICLSGSSIRCVSVPCSLLRKLHQCPNLTHVTISDFQNLAQDPFFQEVERLVKDHSALRYLNMRFSWYIREEGMYKRWIEALATNHSLTHLIMSSEGPSGVSFSMVNTRLMHSYLQFLFRHNYMITHFSIHGDDKSEWQGPIEIQPFLMRNHLVQTKQTKLTKMFWLLLRCRGNFVEAQHGDH